VHAEETGQAEEAEEAPFLLPVEDVFSRRGGRAALVTGRIERGSVGVGDEVETVGHGPRGILTVAAVEAFGRPIGRAMTGMNVGLLFDVAEPTRRGQVLAAPGSTGAHARFTADLTLLPEADGGAEVHDGDRLQLHLRADSLLGTVSLAPGTHVLLPCHGGPVTVTLELPVPLEAGQTFPFRHHRRAAGRGTVTAVPPNDA
jgi:elongation factor Tu